MKFKLKSAPIPAPEPECFLELALEDTRVVIRATSAQGRMQTLGAFRDGSLILYALNREAAQELGIKQAGDNSIATILPYRTSA